MVQIELDTLRCLSAALERVGVSTRIVNYVEDWPLETSTYTC